jgi:hypothetical protein
VTLAAKLQIKPGESVSVVNQPPNVELDLEGSPIVDDADAADAVILFCANQGELDQFRGTAVSAAKREALTWVVYPKAGRLGTDLNRDRLWELVREHGIRPVRQIAVDDVWSALRMRPS